VRVNAVCAGFVRTPATEGHEEAIGKLVARVPLGRRAESSEIADAVTYLCSDHAAFVTGHGLVLDGAPSVSPID
jgi:NAD(P)-dependent dehydrogenase (short-subunit alcohol dehydrogenase family)